MIPEFQYACSQLDIDISNLRQKFSDVIQDEIGNILFDQDIKINDVRMLSYLAVIFILQVWKLFARKKIAMI